MMSKDDIERKLESKMTEKFNSASGNPKLAIHLSAAAGAVICAILPVGLDVWALRTCEVIMIICIASLYDEKLTKSAARGILVSSFAQLVGEATALTLLTAANTANLFNPVVAYGIKSSIAVGLIESIGHEALKHYERKHKDPEKQTITAFDAMCAVGGIADAARIVNAVGETISGMSCNSGLQNTIPDTFTSSAHGNTDQISFCGDEIQRKIHESELKVENQKRTVKRINEWIARDISLGRDTTLNRSKLKYAINALNQLEKELSRLAVQAAQ